MDDERTRRELLSVDSADVLVDVETVRSALVALGDRIDTLPTADRRLARESIGAALDGLRLAEQAVTGEATLW